MSDIYNIANIYRAEILRAVLGPGAHAAKAHDPHRLNQIAERLAESEAALEVLRANGHGKTGMTLLEVVRSLPMYARGVPNDIFRRGEAAAPASKSKPYPDLGEVLDLWTAQ